ncbi:PTS sugar transporter subunit IIA [Anaerorhabdus sp.]|uniref:PTS sugar transporter subunit IIA n=1 Tax=Anaerorhabdus sp. TaxID=1872524 RepID=UPI002FC68B86
MFNIKSKKNQFIYAPVSGVSYPIQKVPDETFNQKLMGEGMAICTYDSLVVSPIKGEVKVIASTKHALMIEGQGVELLLHIGVNTCNFGGEGFDVLVKLNEKVNIGTPLVRVNHEFFQSNEINSDVILVYTNKKGDELLMETEKEVIKGKSVITTIL